MLNPLSSKEKQIRINAWAAKSLLQYGYFKMFQECPGCGSHNISDYVDGDVYQVRRFNQVSHWHYVCFDCSTAATVYHCVVCGDYYDKDNTRLIQPTFEQLDLIEVPIAIKCQVKDLLIQLEKRQFEK